MAEIKREHERICKQELLGGTAHVGKMEGRHCKCGQCEAPKRLYFVAIVVLFVSISCTFYTLHNQVVLQDSVRDINNQVLVLQREMESSRVMFRTLKAITENLSHLKMETAKDSHFSRDKGVENELESTDRMLKSNDIDHIRTKRSLNLNRLKRKEPTEMETMHKSVNSLRREMFSLSDRLRYILTYNKDGGSGTPGPPGPPGDSGLQGPPGRNGRDGYHGERGPRGPQGPQGAAGPTGKDGKDGLPGTNGVPGFPGYQGEKGEKGMRGQQGPGGMGGLPGPIGPSGDPGRPGIPGEKGETGTCSCSDQLTSFTDRYHKQNQNRQKAAETKSELVYTRWGSSTCGANAALLYSGQISMSKYERDGIKVGSDVMCMPIQSKTRFARWARHLKYIHALEQQLSNANNEHTRYRRSADSDSDSSFPSMMKTLDASVKSLDATDKSNDKPPLAPNVNVNNMPKSDANDTENIDPSMPDMKFAWPRHNGQNYASLQGTRKYITCSMCHATKVTSQITIPSQTSCPMGWRREYYGYLMAFHHGTNQSQLICVDYNSLGLAPGKDPRLNQIITKFMAYTELDCKSLPCPPHKPGAVTCAVCVR